MPENKRVGLAEGALAVAALALLGVVAFRWALDAAIHNRPIQVVPELKGKSIAGALDALQPLNLSLVKEGAEFNASVPIGSILRQRPPVDTKVREGKAIRVVVSQGGETVFTPGVSGLPLRNAEMLLRQNQLLLGEVTESYSVKLAKGLVLSQDPKAESSVERNSLVNVVVSAGPAPDGIVLMPDLQRKMLADAQSWAATAGVKLTVLKDEKSLFPYGTILSQEPALDTQVSAKTPVKVTISARQGGAKLPAGGAQFRYQVPQGGSESLVRIVQVDQQGEKELFNGLRAPGSKIELPVPAGARARIKIFLNGILIEEKDL